MFLSKLCVERPVLIFVLNIIILLAGLLGVSHLKLRELPEVDIPKITIETDAPNISSSIVESEITNKIEAQLNGLSNLKNISSNSKDSKSVVKLHFMEHANLEESANQVRDLVGRIQADFPLGTKSAKVIKVDTSTDPILYIGVQSTLQNQTDLSEYVQKYIIPHLENISGIAKVSVYGERKAAVNILLDMMQLKAHKFSIEYIANKITQATKRISGGKINFASHEINLDIAPTARNIAQLKRIVLRTKNSAIVRLSDIAMIELAPINEDINTKVNGADGLVLAIIPKVGANPVSISKATLSYFNTLENKLPKGMYSEVLFDQAVYITSALKEVAWTLLFSIVLVGIIIYLMTGSLISAIIPLFTVPFSIIGIFSMMWWAGFSINLLTMLALVLAIGLVVDDAIVMLENIERHLKILQCAKSATEIALKEMTSAIISMSITLAVVFIPIALSQGVNGQLFREFALTLAGAVIISGFVALTLIPMLAAKKLAVSHLKSNSYKQWLEIKLQALENNYQHFLEFMLDRISLVAMLFIITALFGLWFYSGLVTEIIPSEDQGMIFVPVIAPAGSNHHYTDNWLRHIETIFNKIPEKTSFATTSGFGGGNQGFAILKLKPWDKRIASSEEIRQRIMPLLTALPGVNAFPILPSTMYSHAENKINIVLTENAPYSYLKKHADKLQHELKKISEISALQVKLNFAKDQMQFNMYPDKMFNANVTAAQINNILKLYTGGKHISDLNINNSLLPIYIKSKIKIKSSLELQSLFVPNQYNQFIPISEIGQINIQHLPSERFHFNKVRAVSVTAEINGKPSLTKLKQQIETILSEVNPKGMHYEFKGAIKRYSEGTNQMLFIFIMAFILIFLVLAAQFESFLAPIAILSVVPVSIAGSWLGLHIAHLSFNIYSQIACITLIGLISKHGILMVEYAKQIRAEGVELKSAIVLAAKTRLRPILMTTLACVVGTIPLALAAGPGSAARNSMGVAVVFGMSFGTICSLCFVPVTYYLLFKVPSREKIS